MLVMIAVAREKGIGKEEGGDQNRGSDNDHNNTIYTCNTYCKNMQIHLIYNVQTCLLYVPRPPFTVSIKPTAKYDLPPK